MFLLASGYTSASAFSVLTDAESAATFVVCALVASHVDYCDAALE